MKLIVKKSNYENDAKAPFVKRNLVEVCKWFNFIEDDMHIQFPDEHINLQIGLDYFIANPDMYTRNGVNTRYQMLPTRGSWDCYCLMASNKMPLHFIYINKSANIFNGFSFDVSFSRDAEVAEIDTRTYNVTTSVQ